MTMNGDRSRRKPRSVPPTKLRLIAPGTGGACKAIDVRATDEWCQADCDRMVAAFPTFCEATGGGGSTGTVVGAGFAVVAAAGLVVFGVQRRRKQRKLIKQQTEQQLAAGDANANVNAKQEQQEQQYGV